MRKTTILALALLFTSAPLAAQQPATSYAEHVAPVLRKYCISCHGPDEANAGLRLDSFAAISAGGESGPVILPGQARSSRLIRVLTGDVEPQMPPDDSPAPPADAIDQLQAWINAGALGPEGQEPAPVRLVVPAIKSQTDIEPVTAVSFDPRGETLALARFGRVSFVDRAGKATGRTLEEHPGKITALCYTPDGQGLVTASGVAGLFGEAVLWNVETGERVATYRGHRDLMYAATLSPNRRHLATAGYDREILIWDTKSAEIVGRLAGHNGAIYDLAFSPDGAVLASASADETIKLWRVDTGERLDTLPQPLAEQYTVAFSPNGQWIVAGGADNRIRVWRFTTHTSAGTNPLVHARFAHEGPLVHLQFSQDGRRLASAAEDRTVKIWETQSFTEVHLYPPTGDVPAAMSLSPRGDVLAVGTMDGSVQLLPVKETGGQAESRSAPQLRSVSRAESQTIAEVEPNQDAEHATPMVLPAIASGVIGRADSADDGDVDCFRFDALAGQPWIFETRAARDGSPLDSRIEILDDQGRMVERLVFQAVRDSYITFRGINSSTMDIRVHNWEEMELNEWLYLGGEVTKLFLAPRGPDSGFQLYHVGGRRKSYFDTTATTHALHEPCYTVVPHLPGTTLVPSGLPVFPLYFDNDDDALRRWKGDSQLSFAAPSDGTYVARVTDVRGFSGADFKYTLLARAPKPDFRPSVRMANQTVAAGSGKEFEVVIDRVDGFDGEVRFDIENLPDGMSAPSPLVVEAGHTVASGSINALPTAGEVSDEAAAAVRITATAMIGGQPVRHPVDGLKNLRITSPPKLIVSLALDQQEAPRTLRVGWTRATVSSATSAAGATMTIDSDSVVRVGGPNPATDTYRVDLQTGDQPITGVRIEALGDASLPGGGPGRAPDHGNFVVSGVDVMAMPAHATRQPRAVGIAAVLADYAQPSWPARAVLDGKPETGWSVGTSQKSGEETKLVVKRSGKDPRHTLDVFFESPVHHDGGTRLRIAIAQRSQQHFHNVGRFRMWVTYDEPFSSPAVPELVIRPGQTVTARLRVDRQGFGGRIQFESLKLNLPHGVIIDNVGLNGVLIPEGQSERTIFLTAASWVQPQTRSFHLRANEDGQQTSWPMRLRITH